MAIASLMATAPSLSAQLLQDLEGFAWRIFTAGDGLPVSEVRDVAEGGDGYLYVATSRGLVRFDGVEFRSVALAPMRSAVVNDLFTDDKGRVWVLSGEAEIGVFKNGHLRVFPEVEWGGDGGPRSNTNRWLYSGITQTSDGDIWFVDDDGLLRITSEGSMAWFGTEHGLPRDSVVGLCELPDGEHVVATYSRLYRVRRSGPTDLDFEPFGPSLRSRHGRLSLWVRCDNRGLWIEQTDGTVLRYVDKTFTRFGPGGAPLHLDSLGWEPGGAGVPGFHWILSDEPAEDGRGRESRYVNLRESLVRRDGARFVRGVAPGREPHLFQWRGDRLHDLGFRQHAPEHWILAMTEDHEGSLWLATNRGLVLMSPRRTHVLRDEHPLAHVFTAPVLQTRDRSVWVGTWGEGLHRFRPDGGEETYIAGDGLPSDQVRALYEDTRGVLWVGTSGGIASRGTDGRWTSGPTTRDVRTFEEDEEGRLWVATLSQLLVREHGSFRSVLDRGDLGRASIQTIHLDRRGRLWIGTDAGLFMMDGRALRRFGSEDGLRDEFIASIFEEEDGTLWIGTFEHGLHRYRGDRFVAVTTREGLHHNGIWQIVPDDSGGYWMSSDGGIARVRASDLHRVADAIERGRTDFEPLRPVVFSRADGMRNPETNRASPGGVRLRDGRIVFNGIEGLNVIEPSSAVRPLPPSPTVIDRVDADGSVFRGDRDSLRLTPPPRHVTFEFSALSFAEQERTEYRYRLDGYDDAWVFSGRRPSASYTNLAPGTYALRVQNRTAHGTWGGTVTGMPLVIPPRFWQRGWFILGSLALLASFLALAHRARVRRLVGIERMRLELAADLHDQVGSSLSSIVLLSEMLEKDGGREGRRGGRIRRIGQAAEDAATALRDVIWLVDPQSDRLSSLVERMKKATEQMLPGKDVRFEAAVQSDAALSPGFQRDTLLLFKEALHNIAKHAEAECVEIALRASDGRLEVSIRDDGVGFDPAISDTGYGMITMRRRAERIGATFEIRAVPGEGTRVRFSASMA